MGAFVGRWFILSSETLACESTTRSHTLINEVLHLHLQCSSDGDTDGRVKLYW